MYKRITNNLKMKHLIKRLSVFSYIMWLVGNTNLCYYNKESKDKRRRLIIQGSLKYFYKFKYKQYISSKEYNFCLARYEVNL